MHYITPTMMAEIPISLDCWDTFIWENVDARNARLGWTTCMDDPLCMNAWDNTYIM